MTSRYTSSVGSFFEHGKLGQFAAHNHGPKTTEQQITPLEPKTSDYEGLTWHNVKEQGFRVPEDGDAHADSWLWKQKNGWRVWDVNGVEYWLCKMCHAHRSPKRHWFKSSKSTMRAKEHLKMIHHIGARGTTLHSPERKAKRKLDEFANGYETATASAGEGIVPANPFSFRESFLQCVIAGHISMRGLEFAHLRRLIERADPQARRLSLDVVSGWITEAYDRQLSVVTKILASATSKVSLSFNGPIRGSSDRSLGVTAHFIVHGGKRTSVLVSLPRPPNGFDTCNTEDMITAIIAEHNLKKSLGYIITNDTGGNSAHMTAFTPDNLPAAQDRWLRCPSQILTQVARTVLFGSDADSLDRELVSVQDDEVQRTDVWRQRGPCGKLHNIVAYFGRYHPQWKERFKEDQRLAMPGAKVDVFKHVEHGDTGWEAMDVLLARALHLRPALDELIEKEVIAHRASRRDRHDFSRPLIADDRLGPHDWQVLRTYHDTLQHIKDAKDMLQGQAGSRFGAIWQVLPQFHALLAQLDKSRQRQFPYDDRRATSPHLQGVRPEEPTPRTFAAQQCMKGVHKGATVRSQKATPQDDGRTAMAHRFDAEIDRAAVEYQSNANISTVWQIIHDHCETLHANVIYIAAVVLHPRIKWRYFEAKWRGRRDVLSGCVSALNKHWRDKYKDKSTNSGSSSEGMVRGIERAADEWSDGEAWDLDQLEEYQSEQPDRSYESTDSPVDYWVKRRRMWPQLSAMALDIYSVPVAAGGPDLVFNRASKAWPAADSKLDDDTRACLMCLRVWQSSGILEIDDDLFEGTTVDPNQLAHSWAVGSGG